MVCCEPAQHSDLRDVFLPVVAPLEHKADKNPTHIPQPFYTSNQI